MADRRRGGRIGRLPAPLTLSALLERAAKALPPTVSGVRAAGDPDRQISTVAVCGGAALATRSASSSFADKAFAKLGGDSGEILDSIAEKVVDKLTSKGGTLDSAQEQLVDELAGMAGKKLGKVDPAKLINEIRGDVNAYIDDSTATTSGTGDITLNDQIQVSSSTANVVFNYLGAATTPGTFTVRNPTDNNTLFVIVATTGRVTICPTSTPC